MTLYREISKHENGTMQEALNLLEIDNPLIQISGVKKSQNAEGVIVRVYNPGGETEKCTLNFASEIKNAYNVNMNEQIEQALALKDKNTISLDIKPYKIVTILIRF